MRHHKILVAVVVAALLVAGCGAPGPGGGGAVSGTIRLSGWSSSPAEDALLTGSIKEFMDANPGVEVKWEPVAQDYATVLKTNLAAGTEADVFYVDVFEVDSLMKTGRLLAIDELMRQTSTNANDFAQPLLNAFKHDGKTYGIPKDFNTLGLVYNKDLFASAGAREPTNDWTWNDLTTAARSLTKGDAVGVCIPPDAARFVPFLWQAGGDLKTINDAKGVQAAEFYTSFQKAGTGKTHTELGMGWCGEAVAKGKAAIAFEGGWLPAFLDKDFPQVKYGVVEMPKGPAAKANLAFTVSYSISARTKNPTTAWALVNHLTGLENQRKVLRSGFALPTRTALSTDQQFQTNRNSKAIFDGYQYAKAFNWGAGANNGKINDAINKALESILLGRSSVKDALDRAAAEIKTLLP